MKRGANLVLSSFGEEAVAHYRQALWEHEDLTGCSHRIRVLGHLDLCSSRIELEVLLMLRRNVPLLLS